MVFLLDAENLIQFIYHQCSLFQIFLNHSTSSLINSSVIGIKTYSKSLLLFVKLLSSFMICNIKLNPFFMLQQKVRDAKFNKLRTYIIQDKSYINL
ncbi:hypothetical protein pb186bvf_013145 [Paramecium bursaria]